MERGRPEGKAKYFACKVTRYRSEEEYELFTEFAKPAWYTFSYSGAASNLLF